MYKIDKMEIGKQMSSLKIWLLFLLFSKQILTGLSKQFLPLSSKYSLWKRFRIQNTIILTGVVFILTGTKDFHVLGVFEPQSFSCLQTEKLFIKKTFS
jgi:hypothetical protein